MKKQIFSILFGLVAMTSQAITPLWLRDVQVSPDGTSIAFCYKGDIYKVNAQGGQAIRLTTQASYECTPIWSPNSKQIAFASDRDGNFDIYIMSANGGSAKKLTQNSTSELPSTFTPDGKHVVFSASIQDPAQSALFPTSAMTELYQVPVEGGRTQQIIATPAEAVCYTKDGKSFLYQDRKGFEDEWRKHHTSSVTRDIWLYDAKSRKHTNLTNIGGEDRDPSLAPDGKTVYFLSERNGGSMNVYTLDMNQPKTIKSVTTFKTHPVRFLSISDQGMLCYTYDGEIYTQGTNGKPQKIAIELTRDDDKQIADIRVTSGARSATSSPDGKQIAFIVRGEVYVTSADYATTKQITHTPAGEQGVTFAPDNRTLAYASERSGNWELYLAKIERKDDPNFPNATLIKEEVLLPSKTIERSYPQFSPDGKELAFIQDRRKLMVVNLESKKVRQITDGSLWHSTGGGFEYAWSPDGKWFTLCFIGNKHDPYSDIGIVSAQGGNITNLTNSGYTSGSPRWVMDGNAILFATERYGMRNHASWGSMEDVMLCFVNQDAYDKYRLSKEDYELLKEVEKEQEKLKKGADKKDEKKEEAKENKNIVIELDGIQDRIVRLTPNSSSLGSAIIDKKGETLYYTAAFESGMDLWKIDLRKKDVKLMTKNVGYASFEMSKDGKHIFLLGSRMQKMDAASGKLTPISYNGSLKMDLADEREAMFDHVYKQQQKRFYNVNMHGVDWDAMTAAYRKFLPHIDNNYDYAELLSEWLGELNVSHTGGRYRPNPSGYATSSLGLLYDWNYTGKGLKVDEVVEGSPFDNARSKMKAGVIIEKINGTEITPETDYNTLLNDQSRKKTLVSLYHPQTKERWEEVVLPISGGAFNTLLYNRWVKQRAADVERWSNGRLGYVHIQSMGDPSFRGVYSDILGKYNHCDGIVIDTRFNGGGRLHEDVEILFSGKKYLTQVVRGQESCDMPSRRWNKASIMVQCEANYSNAHGTPWVYKFKEMGKLVGAPVAGTMTTVSWENMQDTSLTFGIPVVGYRKADGTYLENDQLEPDVHVLNDPATVVKGEDTQLKVAVETLMKDLGLK
ncbi:MAG: PD40 domain-containing protein [Bacteroidaceae bacterium]|nr:PD40 domain-containing protein [Bacteroidaceae bacterium]